MVHAGVQPQIMGFLPALKADGPAIAVSGDDINPAPSLARAASAPDQ
jgi:hypothetical protein